MNAPVAFTAEEHRQARELILANPEMRPPVLQRELAKLDNRMTYAAVRKLRARLVADGLVERLPSGRPRKDGTKPSKRQDGEPSRKHLLERIRQLEAELADVLECEADLVRTLLVERAMRRTA